MLSSWTKSAALLLGLVFLLLPSADAAGLMCQVCMGPGTTPVDDTSLDKDKVNPARKTLCSAEATALDCTSRNAADASPAPVWMCMVDDKGSKDCMEDKADVKECVKDAVVTATCKCNSDSCNKNFNIATTTTEVKNTSSEIEKPDTSDTSKAEGDTPSGESESDGSMVKGWPFDLLLLAAALVWGQQRLRSQA